MLLLLLLIALLATVSLRAFLWTALSTLLPALLKSGFFRGKDFVSLVEMLSGFFSLEEEAMLSMLAPRPTPPQPQSQGLPDLSLRRSFSACQH